MVVVGVVVCMIVVGGILIWFEKHLYSDPYNSPFGTINVTSWANSYNKNPIFALHLVSKQYIFNLNPSEYKSINMKKDDDSGVISGGIS